MNTEQLNCFIKVAENLSFNKAAEQLYISTPGVSRNIKQLEEELGTVLLLRDKHSVALTRAGQTFYNDAKVLLKAHEQVLLHVSESSLSSQLRIYCTSYEELSTITEILKKYRLKNPNITPKINCGGYGRGISLLKQKTIDLALGSENMIINETSIQFHPICQLGSIAIIPQSDPLSKKEEISFENDLNGKTLINMPEIMIPFHSQNRIKDLLALHHRHNHDIECEDSLSCIALARAGYGITVLPEYKLPKQIQDCAKVKVKENEAFTYGILTTTGEISQQVIDFITICKDMFGTNN